MNKRSICLNMIVKNENHVIKRCLSSVKKIIDYWVIVDTGSNDGTQQTIKEFMSDIPGELYECPWVNFAYNRNVALDFAKNKGDYILFIDADDYLKMSASFVMPTLDQDYYFAAWHVMDDINRHLLLFNNRLDWRWKGVVHERPECPDAKTSDDIEGLILVSTQDGMRSKDLRQKYLDDALVLEQAIRDDPENRSNFFYLAMSYDFAQEYASALKIFEKRAVMGGCELEVFASLYRIGFLQEQLGMPSHEWINRYIQAHLYRPTRAEPLFCLASYFLKIGCCFLGYLISKYAVSASLINDYFYSRSSLYDYELLCLYAECSYKMGHCNEACYALSRALDAESLPADARSFIEGALRR